MRSGFTNNSFFVGNQLQVERERDLENVMTGFDAEVGTSLFNLGNGQRAHGFVGLYRYDGEEVGSLTGWRAGISARPDDLLDLSLALQNDSRYETRAVFRIALFTSGSVRGKRSRTDADAARLAYLAAPVARQSYLTVVRDIVHDRVNATTTGNEAFRIRHVTLGGTGSGDGTAERPFTTLAQGLSGAQAGDIVYVRAAGTNVPAQPAFTVPAGVRVLSSGVAQQLDTAQRSGLRLPGSNSGNLPTIGDTVTLSNGSEINGFAIRDTSGAGVLGTGVSNVAIRNNVISKPGREGIRLIDVTGTVVVENNTITDAQTIIPNADGVSNSVGGTLFEDKPFFADLDIAGGVSGIRVYNATTGTVTARINGNNITNSISSGILVGAGGNANITAEIHDNISNNNTGSGVFAFYFGQARMALDIRRNTTNNNQGRLFNESGIRFAGFDSAVGTATIDSNISKNNLGNGIFTGANDDCTLTATVTNNIMENNQGNGIFSGARRTSELNVTIAQNTATGTRFNPNVIPPTFPNGHGILVGVQEEATINALVDRNATSTSERSGIYLFGAGTTRLTASVTRNISRENGEGGITTDIGPVPGNAAARGDVIIRENTVENNIGGGPPGQGTGGIILRVFNGSTLSAIVEGNFLTGNATAPGAYAGMGLLATGTSTLLARVRNNTILDSGTEVNFLAQSPTQAPGKLSLLYRNNTSNKPALLVRVPGTLFEADFGDNTGAPVIVPAEPVAPLPPNTVP